MFASLKAKLYLFGAFLAGAAVLAFRILLGRLEDAKEEIEIHKRTIKSYDKKQTQIKDTHDARTTAREESAEVGRANQEARASGERPTGQFGDPRLRNRS